MNNNNFETISNPQPVSVNPSAYIDMQQNAAHAAQLLKAIANESRLLILCILNSGEMSVSQLNNNLSLSQSALSQHLAILRKDGLVKTRRESQTIFYSLADGRAQKVLDSLKTIYC